MVKKTVLYDAHLALKADMVEFSGFMMPVRYQTTIVEEHLAVRHNVGMFDTSHMGRYWITGGDVKTFLNLVVPRDIRKLQDGMAAYTFILNENGGFKDDIIIYQFSETEFMLVCNAGNRDKIWSWLIGLSLIWTQAGKSIRFEDKSEFSCMIAVQGPKAIHLLESIFQTKLPEKRFRFQWINYEKQKILFSTTGYTGEAGGELMIFDKSNQINHKSQSLWNMLLDHNIIPCALGSRNTLRLEAGYRLYGNDMNESIHLLESGLDFVPFVHLEKEGGFIGQVGVIAMKGKITKGVTGFKLLTKGIPRHGYPIFVGKEKVGVVLSGTQSPLNKESFGMAIINNELKTLGSKFEIDIRGKRKEAEAINLPFYNTKEFGMTRD